MSRYLDVVKRIAETHAHAKSAQAAKSGVKDDLANAKTAQTAQTDEPATLQNSQNSQISHSQKLFSILAALEARCPDYVDLPDWKLAVADGRAFLSAWGTQAEALGWTSRDLFRLAPVPERPSANYQRLARYDLTGLVWLLKGRPVLALSDTSAAIQGAPGAVLNYRRFRKPALGPFGDSLDDLGTG
jgi:hypothetical protein